MVDCISDIAAVCEEMEVDGSPDTIVEGDLGMDARLREEWSKQAINRSRVGIRTLVRAA